MDFNLDTLALTRAKKEKGNLNQKTPVLSQEECLHITSYHLPFSITSYEKESDIEEIFRRINSYGKRLSDHELRQAGSLSVFSELVRTIAEHIRGDVSASDKLLLGHMRKISINNKGLNYGVDMRKIFWNKHHILTDNNIRASRDEELVAHLVLAMLLDCDVNVSTTSLQRAYGISDDENENIDVDALIKKYGGSDFIQSQFLAIYQEVKKTLDIASESFFNLVYPNGGKYLNLVFQVIFLAYYRLLVKEEMKIDNYKKLHSSLRGIGDSCVSPHIERIKHKSFREKSIKSTIGLIRENFSKRNNTDPVLSNGVVKLESLLNSAKTENNSYDFKQGLHQMDNEHKNITDKVLKTLCSFVNLGRNSVGYVVIGVADKKGTADSYEKYYNVKPIKYNDFYITGIEEEAKRYKNIDEYRTKLEQAIKAADIEPSLYKNQILQNIDLFSYNDKSVIIMKIKANDDPVKFCGKFYQRRGTMVEEVKPNEERQVWALFLGK